MATATNIKQYTYIVTAEAPRVGAPGDIPESDYTVVESPMEWQGLSVARSLAKKYAKNYHAVEVFEARLLP